MGLAQVAFLCDFDGTITLRDVGHRLFSRFAGRASRAAVERWLRDEIGSRRCMELECAAVRATEEELLAYVGDADMDPTFPELVTLSREAPFPLVVVSDGLDFYIRHILERHDLGDLPILANEAVFEDGRMRPVFPYGEHGCGECGNCKGYHAGVYRDQGYRVVFAGDGLSDRCGVEGADLSLAREGGDLARWCSERGIPHLTFRRLGEVGGLLAGRSFEDLRAEARQAVSP